MSGNGKRNENYSVSVKNQDQTMGAYATALFCYSPLLGLYLIVFIHYLFMLIFTHQRRLNLNCDEFPSK